MRFLVLSDLHLEFAPFEPPVTAADAVILAGDIGLGLRGLDWAVAQWPDRLVLYVPGNHEFYGHSNPHLLRKLEARAAERGAYVLSDRAVTIAGVRFLGATLWTDMRLGDNQAVAFAVAQEELTDYRRIRVDPGFRRLRPADTVMWHTRSVRWLQQELEAGGAQPTVVVTHHAPSGRSLGPGVADPVAPAYASDLDELVASSGAVYWIHGHTHAAADYVIGRTRVVSNQRGYPEEPVAGFDPGLVLEV